MKYKTISSTIYNVFSLFKKAIYSILLFLCFGMVITGCEKLMKEYNDNPSDIDTEEKMVSAITGAYDCFKDIFTNNTSSRDWYQIPNVNGDEFNHSRLYLQLFTGTDTQWVEECEDASIYGGEYTYYYSNETDPWYYCYKTIISLNNIINQFGSDKKINEPMSGILGEAYLLRGYVYFRLTRVYGRIPIITGTQVDYNIESSSYKDIYEHVVSDLKKAYDLLPANKKLARIAYTTPHKGTVKAILAEVYLNMAGYPLKDSSGYEKAAEICKEIIDSADFFGFGIVPDFAELWQNTYPVTESVFSLYYNKTTDFQCVINMNNTNIINIRTYNTPYISARKFYNNYPQSYRKEKTFASVFPAPSSTPLDMLQPVPSTWLEDCRFKYVNYEQMSRCIPVFYKKFEVSYSHEINSGFSYREYIDSMSNIFDYSTQINLQLYVYRYAQTLLTYAEAMARSGQLNNNAYEAVNIIRRRAHKADIYTPSVYDITEGLSAEQFLDSVVWERAWELCAEPEGRWFDLVRLEMVEDLPQLRDRGDRLDLPDEITKDYYFRSIPQSEIYINPKLEYPDNSND